MTVAGGVGNGIGILAKTSAVLEVLRVRGQASVPEIAQEVDEPVSSLYRLISHLSDVGWVEPGSRRGQYRIGAGLLSIGAMVESRLDLQGITRSVLRPKRSQTIGTWSLFVRRALRAVCIEIVAYQMVECFAPRVGSSLPLDEGAASLVLVASLPGPERDAVLEQLLATRSGGRGALEVRHRFRIEAEKVRRAGLAIDIEETVPGVASVAAPVFNRRGEIQAAICLSGLDPQRIRAEDTKHDIDVVRLAAAQISAEFGYRDGEREAKGEPVLGEEE